MLRIEDVRRVFAGGVVALEGVCLEIGARDFVVLLGPSGCGKSTLLRLIGGLDVPDAGSLMWAAGPPAAGELGVVFQDATLMPWASAAENAALPLRLRGLPVQPALEMLTRVGLGGFEAARPSQLSGGMRMRVSIARAMAPRPKMLLMDEPFAALDEFTRHRLQDDVRTLTAACGAACVFVTHSIYEAAFLATKVVVMSPRPGRIAAVLDYGAAAPDRLGPVFLARVAALTEALHKVHVV